MRPIINPLNTKTAFDYINRLISQFFSYKTGRWYRSIIQTGALAGTAIAANTMYAVPFFAWSSQRFDRIGITVSSGAVSSNIKLGIYSDVDGLPGDLLYDCGTAASSASAGDITFNITLDTVKDRWYWLALVSDGTPSILLASTTAVRPDLGESLLSDIRPLQRAQRSFTLSSTTTPLPSSFGTPTLSNNGGPGIKLRAA